MAEMLVFPHAVLSWAIAHWVWIAAITFVVMVRYRLLTDFVDLAILGICVVWAWAVTLPFVAQIPIVGAIVCAPAGAIWFWICGVAVILLRQWFGRRMLVNNFGQFEDWVGDHIVDPPLNFVRGIFDWLDDWADYWLGRRLLGWVRYQLEAIGFWLADHSVVRVFLGLSVVALVVTLMYRVWVAMG